MKLKLPAIPVLFSLLMTGCFDKEIVNKSTQPQTMPAEIPLGIEQTIVFYSMGEGNTPQNEVNEWLLQNNKKYEIIRVLQTQGGYGTMSRIVITIFYKKTG